LSESSEKLNKSTAPDIHLNPWYHILGHSLIPH
jgi:hypothetical protein